MLKICINIGKELYKALDYQPYEMAEQAKHVLSKPDDLSSVAGAT